MPAKLRTRPRKPTACEGPLQFEENGGVVLGLECDDVDVEQGVDSHGGSFGGQCQMSEWLWR